jgi:predicted aspartyl protease
VSVPLSVYDGGAIVVAVTIGGEGPFRFLLDTGSTRSAMTARLARQLRSPVVAQTSMVTPAGRGARNVAFVRDLRVGRALQVSVAALVVPDDALPHAGGLDGLLGQDVLANRSYTIDYPRHELVWHVGGTAHVPGHRLPLTVTNGLFFVSLPTMDRAAEPVRLLADSGADTLVLFGGADWLTVTATSMGTGVLRTSAGLQVGHHLRLDQLDLGGVVLRNPSALLLTEREPTGLLGDGLLPLHLFARVTFDAAGPALIVAAR